MLIRFTFLLVTSTFLTGCSTSIQEYGKTSPQFTLETFFNGKLTAWGTFQDYSNKVIRRFRVDMHGSWQGSKGILDEDFFYDDGETQKRIWYLEKVGKHQYTGKANDIIGIAKGAVQGFALNWHYTIALPVGDTTYTVQFNDWMYLIDSNHVINRATISKWGIPVGEVTLFIQKHGINRKPS